MSKRFEVKTTMDPWVIVETQSGQVLSANMKASPDREPISIATDFFDSFVLWINTE